MIADTAMALFELAPEEVAWYRDRAAVRRALDASLETSLGAMVHYACVIRQAKKAPNRAAVHALVATGEEHIFALQDGKKPTRMTMVLGIVDGALNVDARCYAPELAERNTAVKRSRAWFADHGVAYTFHDFKSKRVPADELDRWMKTLGWEALVNKKGTTWRKLSPAAQAAVTDAKSARALMLREPSVIKRPVVAAGDELTVGFTPEAWAPLAKRDSK